MGPSNEWTDFQDKLHLYACKSPFGSLEKRRANLQTLKEGYEKDK